ncbi:hypothetical protein BX600DRAFT_156346 [Xylariales sp. PMI_506]|nr:hypothetical protein BX600DRAFT_156346 [Xylariales sp. PMI_506]
MPTPLIRYVRQLLSTASQDAHQSPSPPGCVAIKSVGADGSLRVTMLLVGADGNDKYVFLDRAADGLLSSSVHGTGESMGYMDWDTLKAFERVGANGAGEHNQHHHHYQQSRDPRNSKHHASRMKIFMADRGDRKGRGKNASASNSGRDAESSVAKPTVSIGGSRSSSSNNSNNNNNNRFSRPDLSGICLEWLTYGNLPLSGYLEALEIFSGWP